MVSMRELLISKLQRPEAGGLARRCCCCNDDLLTHRKIAVHHFGEDTVRDSGPHRVGMWPTVLSKSPDLGPRDGRAVGDAGGCFKNRVRGLEAQRRVWHLE